MSAKKQFDASSFAEECYQEYLAYDRVNGSGKPAAFVDFCFEIINNREDMKEYLSSSPDLKTKYMNHLPEITETFPFQEYRKLFDSAGVRLSYQGTGELYLSFFSSAGQDFNLSINDVEPDFSNLLDQFNVSVKNFDVSEETYLWLDGTGHGKNGAPYEMIDVLNDMKHCIGKCSEILEEVTRKVDSHNKAMEEGITSDSVGELFIRNLGGQMYWKDVFPSLAKASEKTVTFENGNLLLLRQKLGEYFESLGITEGVFSEAKKESENMELTSDDRKKLSFIQSKLNGEVYELEQKDIASRKPIVTKFTDRLLSSIESKVCKMFDELFTASSTYPEKFVHEVVIPGHNPEISNPVKWWEFAVNHAANSGGALFASSFERMKTFEKFGLIDKGICDLPEDNPVFENHFAEADRMFGNYLYTYLHLKGLLKEEDRLKAVKKDQEWQQKYGR